MINTPIAPATLVAKDKAIDKPLTAEVVAAILAGNVIIERDSMVNWRGICTKATDNRYKPERKAIIAFMVL